MTNKPENGDRSNNSSESTRPAPPKRGLIPTPKSDIEKTQPYIPKTGDEGTEEGEHDPTLEADDEKEE